MNRKPKCIIVTGRPGSGKTTLARRLGERLWMPVISRDEIKEGYINTCGIRHDELPNETNGLVTDIFFGIISQYVAGKISVVLDAAFQHNVWESRMAQILELASTSIVLCSTDEVVAARRQLERSLRNPKWEFYHGNRRVAHYRTTGEILPPDSYTEPKFDVPTIRVSTDEEWVPCIDAIVKQLQST